MVLGRRSTPPSSTVSTSARISFEVGGTDDLAPDARYDGILAWYSLIHLTPGAVGPALAQVRRALRPGGSLLRHEMSGPKLHVLLEHAPGDGFAFSRRQT